LPAEAYTALLNDWFGNNKNCSAMQELSAMGGMAGSIHQPPYTVSTVAKDY